MISVWWLLILVPAVWCAYSVGFLIGSIDSSNRALKNFAGQVSKLLQAGNVHRAQSMCNFMAEDRYE